MVTTNADLKVGDRVRLSPETEWEIGDSNPLNTMGIVVFHPLNGSGEDDIEEEDSDYLRVQWDNGVSNSYFLDDDDLILVLNRGLCYQSRDKAREKSREMGDMFTVLDMSTNPAGRWWISVKEV